jgi:hypothetical protein
MRGPDESTLRAKVLADAIEAVAGHPLAAEILGEYSEEAADHGPTRVVATSVGYAQIELHFADRFGLLAVFLYDRGEPQFHQDAPGARSYRKRPPKLLLVWHHESELDPLACDACGQVIPPEDIDDYMEAEGELPGLCSDCENRHGGSRMPPGYRKGRWAE